jgi:hypothetical protein
MAKTGSNGKQDGEKSVKLVEAWIKMREDLRDWDKYAYCGRINRTAVAAEKGLSKSVVDQNPRVKALLKAQDKIWFEPKKLSTEAIHERAEKRTQDVSPTNNQFTKRIAELEVEVRQLRKQLTKHQSLEALVQCGFPGQRS